MFDLNLFTMNSPIVNDAFRFVKWLYDEFLPPALSEWQLDQCMELKNYCVRLALQRKFPEKDIEIVALAAILHNTGCVEGQHVKRLVSKKIAERFLLEQKYGRKRIKDVLDCIDSTQKRKRATDSMGRLIQEAKFCTNPTAQFHNAKLEVGDIWP